MAAKKKFPEKNNNQYIQATLGEEFLASSTVAALKTREFGFRTQANIITSKPVRPELPELIMPRRYEALEAEAKNRNVPLRPLVKPVQNAIADIEREINYVRDLGTGRLYVISGTTGSGKTTFLKSLNLFVDNIQIYDLKGLTLDSRSAIEASLAKLNRSEESISIVLLEGREAPSSFKAEEIDLLLTTLNTDFRKASGRRTLFVIPTTATTIAQQISQRAAEIGGMTIKERPFYVFSGPSRVDYVTIVNEMLGALNDSRNLIDYGIPEELSKGLAETSNSIGQFIESCYTEIIERRHKLEKAADEIEHKRIHLWMVFCSSEDDLRRNHDIIRSLTVGNKQTIQVSRALVGDAKEVREWQNRIAEFAQAATYLDLRLLYLPMRTAISIFTAYAPDEVIAYLKDERLIQRETVRARAQESLANTAIGAFLQNRGFVDDPLRRGRLDERQKELFPEIMKIAVGDETILNAMVAETLRQWLNNPEIVVTTEKELNDQRTLVTDIAIITTTDIYCLEMKWRSGQLTDSEVLRETISRVTDFTKNMSELKYLLKEN